MQKKLAIITSHPIQYNAPFFKVLTERGKLNVKVFYTWSQANEKVFDPGFGISREWDIPLTEGYAFTFVENTAAKPGSHHFFGIRNPELIKTITQWAPDAILVFGWSFHSHLNCLRFFKNKIPVLFRGDSTMLDERGGIRQLLRRIMLTWVYQHIDLALYVGKANKNYFLKHGVAEKKLVLALHAVENCRFAAPENKRSGQALKRKLGYSDEDFIVLFAGKLEAKKNPHFVLNLAEKINDKRIKFLIVGNGQLESELKKKAIGLTNVKFLDFQNQQTMPVVYHSADVFLLPSNGPGETWGLAANEAMACGLPVILSEKAGASVDLVKERETGITFLLDNWQKVQSYICELQSNRHLYETTSANVRSHIQQFSLTKIAAATECAVGHLIGETAR